MDVLQYINSKDIRAHLESIGYEFNSLEAAWIIFWCRSLTIEEKHKAWGQLIETMPDCRIEERLNTVPQDSLRDFLREYMRIEKKYIERFCEAQQGDGPGSDGTPYVYSCTIKYDDGSDSECPTVFSSFEILKKTISETEEGVASIHVERMQVDGLDFKGWADLDAEYRFIKFWPEIIDDHDRDIYFNVFEGLWFDFPTPFKKGDILWNPNRSNAGPFVFESLITDRGFLKKSQEESVRNKGDYSDMTYYGYFVLSNEGVYIDGDYIYMDLEYYTEELEGIYRLLKIVSEFIKGEAELDLCFQLYHKIMNEENSWISPYYKWSYVEGYLKDLPGLS